MSQINLKPDALCPAHEFVRFEDDALWCSLLGSGIVSPVLPVLHGGHAGLVPYGPHAPFIDPKALVLP
ncbi:hypothetical protein OPT61_g3949 [Boeremia exigua]|uniref:Uncharacterized protein n=1 Tax=Boeremia exigua TaxID=749465 RepID=A0ACC2IFX8_9PLEO|nr:hypothetical protein OPT61_g3949 [Boeremia exigua]